MNLKVGDRVEYRPSKKRINSGDYNTSLIGKVGTVGVATSSESTRVDFDKGPNFYNCFVDNLVLIDSQTELEF